MITKFVSTMVLGAALAATAAAAPDVVTTVAPVHSITAMVMAGVAEPMRLVDPGASPHDHALRPSGAHALDRADLVVWVGPQLEGFMPRPIAALAADATVLTLAEVPGIHIHGVRHQENWEHEHEGDASDGSHTHDHEGGIDPHLWLDPANGKVWAAAIADALTAADPANAAVYRENAADAQRRIEAAEAQIRSIVAPVRERPYVVFHDAYRYFEERFGMNAVGSVSIGDARKPGAAHVQRLRDKMRNEGVVCIFTEPQFEPRLASTLTEGTSIRVGVLDPIGASLSSGPQLYPTLLLDLARSLRDCLGAK